MKKLGLGILAIVSFAVWATGETLAPHEATRGSLLFKTDVPGRFEEAPLLRTDVRMRVTGLIARVAVTQKFSNPGERWLEGVYVFPLPEQAAVDALRMRVGDRLIEGQIKEREEAKRTYEQASREGKKASLLSQERPNIFTISVANLGPHEEVEVELEYQQVLHYDRGEFRLRFPMVVGPRYIPGVTREVTHIGGFAGSGWGSNTPQVPDADRITPPVSADVERQLNPLSLTVDLDAGFPLKNVTSSYHDVVTNEISPTHRTLTLAGEAVPADRDFELVWAPEVAAAPQAALFTQRHGSDSYALVMIMPPPPVAAKAGGARLPRETIFIIDTSGSMDGASIREAKLALEQALLVLAPQDRFNVIQFNSTTEKLFPSSVLAGPSEVEGARRYVRALDAEGGTEMLPALQAALEGGAESGRVRQVIFMTDGAVGNEDELFAFIQKNLSRSRLFTVGIGSAPNSHFMSKAAQFGRGTYTYIGSPTEVSQKMGELFKKLESPVLTDLEASWGPLRQGFGGQGAREVEAWPSRIPDLYAGEPVVLIAKLSGQESTTLRLKGSRGGAPWDATLELAGGSEEPSARAQREPEASRVASAGVGPREVTEESGIHKLWARKKIAAFMDDLRAGGDREQIRRAVIEVALAHHLVSAYTSLVAVDVTPTRPEAVTAASRALPTNLPAGWVRESVGGALPQGGTSSTLYVALGALFLVLAFMLRRPALAGGR